MKKQDYSDKAFLLPSSINSCALFHAKVFGETGDYMFRIHDCVTGIRLRGNLNDEQGVREALDKVDVLISGLMKFAEFVKANYNQ